MIQYGSMSNTTARAVICGGLGALIASIISSTILNSAYGLSQTEKLILSFVFAATGAAVGIVIDRAVTTSAPDPTAVTLPEDLAEAGQPLLPNHSYCPGSSI